MTSNITTSWEYPFMDPKQEIVGMSGFAKAMPALYGPNFESLNFNPAFNNIRTGAQMSNIHHCTHNDKKGHALTRRCFTEGHQAYCCEWVNEGGRRVRCGTRFKVVSAGCGSHPAKAMDNSINLEIKNLVAGKTDSISWSLLNDPMHTNTSTSKTSDSRNANQELLMQQDEELDSLEAMGALSLRNYSAHAALNTNKAIKDRVEQEQRKLQAAERKSMAVGKHKKTALKVDSAMEEPQSTRIVEAEKKRLFGKSFLKDSKLGRPDASVWRNKRGGKNASEEV
jgi:hypothetical protein